MQVDLQFSGSVTSDISSGENGGTLFFLNAKPYKGTSVTAMCDVRRGGTSITPITIRAMTNGGIATGYIYSTISSGASFQGNCSFCYLAE